MHGVQSNCKMIFKPKLSAVILLALHIFVSPCRTYGQLTTIRSQFARPSDKYKPGVYWYFMDGNMNAESIKKDLYAMKIAGIGSVLFLEVNVGIPRGNVDFLSDRWYSLLGYAIREAKQLGILVSLGIGPGWQGSGGPWVKASQSMQLLAANETVVSADDPKQIVLPVPDPPKAFFGEDRLPGNFKKARSVFYEDVAVLAFPQQANDSLLKDHQEKALFYRAPYSSGTVRPFLSPVSGKDNYKAIPASEILNLSDKMDHEGKLNWHPIKGKWVIIRFVSRNNGAITRPAPTPGLGFESDKFDTVALKTHLDAYVGKILKYIGNGTGPGGLKTLHMDSWEAGSQNWTQKFREEFIKRRGYDPLKYFPAYYGHIIESTEKTERFLWDVRQTTQELIFSYHANYVKKYAKERGFNLSIEPYDMNPTSDLDLGSIADVPMAEFWSKGFGFNSSYSVIEATSIGHVLSRPVIQSESFTAQDNEGWKQYPGSMKNQGDWALAAGINKFFFHTFENQFLPDSLKPGATMGPYGVHWDRSQTWWPMVGAYHTYLARCQYVLQQGRPVADVLYLTPEGCPNVFVPPFSAIKGDTIGDRKGFNFDGCTGGQLMQATVQGHEIQFPGGAHYKVLVLPATGTMTPELMSKIEILVKGGAVIIGKGPTSSPSLVNYPDCDEKLVEISKEIWGNAGNPKKLTYSNYGKGTVITGGEADKLDGQLYPYYETVASILKKLNYTEDFTAEGPVRYTHRTNADWDIYFVSNITAHLINFESSFRTTKGAPEIWDAVTGKMISLNHFTRGMQQTSMRLKLHAYESCFVVFSKDFKWKAIPGNTIVKADTVSKLNYNWDVSFDPKWGGPEHTEFKELKDWTQMSDLGIKYYSGIATYTKTFVVNKISQQKDAHIYLDLGEVKNMARVTLNGKDVGVVWTAPWRIDVTSELQRGNNSLKVEIANLWANRLIGDEKLPYDGPRNGKWPDWLLNGKPRPSKRYTFTTTGQYSANSPLQVSGLLGPVSIIKEYVVTP